MESQHFEETGGGGIAMPQIFSEADRELLMEV